MSGRGKLPSFYYNRKKPLLARGFFGSKLKILRDLSKGQGS